MSALQVIEKHISDANMKKAIDRVADLNCEKLHTVNENNRLVNLVVRMKNRLTALDMFHLNDGTVNLESVIIDMIKGGMSDVEIFTMIRVAISYNVTFTVSDSGYLPTSLIIENAEADENFSPSWVDKAIKEIRPNVDTTETSLTSVIPEADEALKEYERFKFMLELQGDANNVYVDQVSRFEETVQSQQTQIQMLQQRLESQAKQHEAKIRELTRSNEAKQKSIDDLTSTQKELLEEITRQEQKVEDAQFALSGYENGESDMFIQALKAYTGTASEHLYEGLPTTLPSNTKERMSIITEMPVTSQLALYAFTVSNLAKYLRSSEASSKRTPRGIVNMLEDTHNALEVMFEKNFRHSQSVNSGWFNEFTKG